MSDLRKNCQAVISLSWLEPFSEFPLFHANTQDLQPCVQGHPHLRPYAHADRPQAQPTPAFLKFFNGAMLPPASEPLHLLFPLPEGSSPSAFKTPFSPPDLSWMVTSCGKLSLTPGQVRASIIHSSITLHYVFTAFCSFIIIYNVLYKIYCCIIDYMWNLYLWEDGNDQGEEGRERRGRLRVFHIRHWVSSCRKEGVLEGSGVGGRFSAQEHQLPWWGEHPTW